MFTRSILSFLILATTYVAVARGSGQHMICKTVENVFSDTSSGSSPPQVIQGRTRKRGVKGDRGLPGLKGEKGLPGVENTIQEGIDAATEPFENQMTNLESQIARMNKTISCLVTRGVVYNGKCYFAVVHDGHNVHLEECLSLCAEYEGKPADILNTEHQMLVENNLRQHIPPANERIWVWLTATYFPKTNRIQSPSGELRLFRSLRWKQSYPERASSYTSFTGMKMLCYRDAASLDNGVYNTPLTDTAYGAVCELQLF